MKFEFVIDKYKSEIQSVTSFSNNIYDTEFKDLFKIVYDLSSNVSNEFHPADDTELEMILTDVPLVLFQISEKLSQIELSLTTLKLKKSEIKLTAKYNCSDAGDQYEVNSNILECDIMISIYSNLIDRVHRQISYSKELIMGAKKIWDRRKESERSMPVSADNLPEYSIGDKYVHG